MSIQLSNVQEAISKVPQFVLQNVGMERFLLRKLVMTETLMAWDANQIAQESTNISLALLEVKQLPQSVPLFAEMAEYFLLKYVMTGLPQSLAAMLIALGPNQVLPV